jgi:translocation and assembly module TamB
VEESKSKKIARKVWRILWKSTLFLLLFVILILLLIQTAPVQNFIVGKAQNWLTKKLDTKVSIQKLYIDFPKSVVLEKLYIEDKQKDTLVYSGKLSVNMDMWKLIKGQYQVNDISWEDVTARVYRVLPDTAFNFQFIIDSFAKADSESMPAEVQSTDTSAMVFNLKDVYLKNFNVKYHDDVTGNFADVLFSKLALNANQLGISPSLVIDIPVIELDGLKGSFIMKEPLVISEPDTTTSAPIALLLKNIELKNTDFLFKSIPSGFETGIQLKAFETTINRFDLGQAMIDINDVLLDEANAYVTLSPTTPAAPAPVVIEDSIAASWKILTKKLRIENSNIKFDQQASTPVKEGMDYSHIDARQLNLTLKDFYFSNDTIMGEISKGSMKEKSGLDLKSLEVTFLYSDKEAYLKDLYIATPHTILRDAAAIKYPSLDLIADQPGRLFVDINLRRSQIAIRDILMFAPFLAEQPGFANRSAILKVDAQLKGLLNDLNISHFKVSGWQNTRVDLSGRVVNMFNPDQLSANIQLKELYTTNQDILSLLPEKTLPDSFSLPNVIAADGVIRGTTEELYTNININTTDGDVVLNGTLAHFTDSLRMQYDLQLLSQNVLVGKIIGMPEVGGLSTHATLKGQGYVFEKLTSAANITIDSVTYQNYTYKNLQLNGTIDSLQIDLTANIQNDPIHLNLTAKGDLSNEYPSLSIDAMIDSIKTHELNLTTDTIIYRGKIVGDFANTNPDSLEGNLKVVQSILVYNENRLQVDSIQLNALQTDTGEVIQLYTPFMYANAWGHFELTQMNAILQREANKYFNTGYSDTVVINEPYDFHLDIDVYKHKSIVDFLPDLRGLDSIELRIWGDHENGIRVYSEIPKLIYGNNSVKDFRFFATTRDTSTLNGYVRIQELKAGGVTLNATRLQASAHDNELDVHLNINDEKNELKYRLSANVFQPQSGAYAISLNPDSLLLNYAKWNLNPGNRLYYDSSKVLASNFILSDKEQELKLQSDSAAAGYPLTASFKDFRIATLTRLIQLDSLQMDGVINGYATVHDLMQDMKLQSELEIKDFMMNKDTVGTLQANILNQTPNVFNVDLSLKEFGNDLTVKGTYDIGENVSNPMNLQLNIAHLPMKTIEKLAMGYIKQASGEMNGQAKITGSAAAPKVNGKINFQNAVIAPYPINSLLKMENEAITLDERGVHFSQFKIKDSSGQTMVIDGDALTQNFTNYRFDMTLNADNFQLMNKTRELGDIFFGKVFFNTRLNISGTEMSPVVDGTLQVNNKTDFTFILPQEDPSIQDRDGIVNFIDPNASAEDTLFANRYDSLNEASVRDFDINVNITVMKEAVLNVIIDEGNGDMLTVQGSANLTGGIDPSGKITMTGTYELEKGSYNLSFNFLKRSFNIQKGSTITWQGEPTMAEVDITAVYIANTGPIDLVENQLSGVDAAVKNTYRQRLPFEVHLKMKDQLMKPTITFDIILPENGNYTVGKEVIETTNNKLAQVRQEPAEMNKQVFALLLLGRFVAENPFATGNAGLSAEGLARKSVSKLLSDQLNNLAGNLIQGVDINFDLQSTEDYTTGAKANRTDLNVALSKQLLNDRLTVTIGSNFELEGPAQGGQTTTLADNVALDYRLSKDGRYMLRAYRKNKYEGVLEGYIVETGVGFILTVDYNRFRQVFESQRRRERRLNQIKDRLMQKQENENEIP